MRILRLLRWVTAILALLALIGTGVVFADMYQKGTSPENLQPTGVYIKPIYDQATVMDRLSDLSGMYAALIALCVITGIYQRLIPLQDSAGSKTHKQSGVCHEKPLPAPWRKCLQWILLMTGIACVLHGMSNGGLWDVLVKAINICTECIGLG